MIESQVNTPEEALAYMADCTLATVEYMALMKSRKIGEYKRQISIAQKAVNWMIKMGVDMSGTRAAEIPDADVEKWAKGFEKN